MTPANTGNCAKTNGELVAEYLRESRVALRIARRLMPTETLWLSAQGTADELAQQLSDMIGFSDEMGRREKR